MLEIDINDPVWSEYIFNSKNYDFYHTASYHRLASAQDALLLVYKFHEGFIALPVIFRDIENTAYKDCTSVYGYTGPVTNCNLEDISPEVRQTFHQNLKGYFTEKNVVSIFMRLHPLFDEYRLLEGLGRIREVNKTVAIDLTASEQEQTKDYRDSLKKEIISLQADGFYVEEGKTEEDFSEFVAIYHETMERVKADKKYFFTKSYFEDFLSFNCFDKTLLLAKKNGEIIAGALFTYTDKIMQYHLAGTKNIHRKEPVMKMVIDHARQLANEKNLLYLHLGGGVNGSDKDNLFNFKAAFSKYFKTFRTWEYVVNNRVYAELSAHKKVHDDGFFPVYRR